MFDEVEESENLEIVVDFLFKKLVAIKPAFRQAWPTEEEFDSAKFEWLLAFKDSGVHSTEEMKAGLKKLRSSTSPFVPSCGEFIEMCKVGSRGGGAPNAEDAYIEACKNSYPYNQSVWSHPAIQKAAQKTGSFNLCNLPKNRIFSIFKENYENAFDFLKNEGVGIDDNQSRRARIERR